ncbi:Plug domain-containing protein, partial [Acinetobacter baumannii]|nr:Plug domain-containing protein [Acinetobacter baumannii]
YGLGFGAASLAASPAPAPTADDQQAVPIVTVTGEAPGGIAPYAGGQVASGGRVGFLGDRDFMETPFSTIAYTSTYIQDLQAKDLTDVIAKTDPTVFSNGVSGTWSENYSIRGFASATTDLTVNGLAGMAPYY